MVQLTPPHHTIPALIISLLKYILKCFIPCIFGTFSLYRCCINCKRNLACVMMCHTPPFLCTWICIEKSHSCYCWTSPGKELVGQIRLESRIITLAPTCTQKYKDSKKQMLISGGNILEQFVYYKMNGLCKIVSSSLKKKADIGLKALYARLT